VKFISRFIGNLNSTQHLQDNSLVLKVLATEKMLALYWSDCFFISYPCDSGFGNRL